MTKLDKTVSFGMVLLAVVIPLTTWLAVRNQENRSSAATDLNDAAALVVDGNIVNGVCGEMDGQKVGAIPENIDACETGAVNWMDREAEDGSYNWDCIGTRDGVVAVCEAFVGE